MPVPNTQRVRALVVVLAALAGFIDVVCYLTLHHLFTAHMTGNTSKFGVALGRGRLWDALPLAVAPLLFVGGIVLGTLLVDAGLRRTLLVAQAALVAAFMGYGSQIVRNGSVPDHRLGGFYVLAALAITALGLQTAAFTELGGRTVRTTYVSGVLTHLAQALARRLYGRGLDTRRIVLLVAIWLAYAGGATLGSYTLGVFSLWCLAGPTAVLLVAAAAVEWA